MPQEYFASPNALLYFPTTHGVQGPPSGPVVSGLQRQLYKFVAPVLIVDEKLGQRSHGRISVSFLYLPLRQRAHADSCSLKYSPAAHGTHTDSVSSEATDSAPSEATDSAPSEATDSAPSEAIDLTYSCVHTQTLLFGEYHKISFCAHVVHEIIPLSVVRVFSGHVRQIDVPINALYLPAAHASHVGTIGFSSYQEVCWYPAAQSQIYIRHVRVSVYWTIHTREITLNKFKFPSRAVLTYWYGIVSSFC